MTFKVIDKETGGEPTAKVLERMAKNGGLMEMDIDQFYVGEDGQIALADECGRIAYVGSERFEVVFGGDRKILSEIEYEMECTMESDPRTMSDPYHEYGWLFSKINGWRKKLREILD